MSKNKQDILISFADDEATSEVTGSCVHVSYNGLNILIECGLSQGGSVIENNKKNRNNFRFKAKELDYVFLNHLHSDHLCRTPLLYARGSHAQCITPSGTSKIMYAMLENSAMILQGEAKYISKKSKETPPLYTMEDVDNMMAHVEEYEMYQTHYLREDVRFKFISSGHIAFACSLILEIKKGNVWKKIYYTSDIGNIAHKNYYVNNLDVIKSADITISEATYCTAERSNSDKDQRKKDIERIKSVVSQHDKVLIPTFALHRSATLLTVLYEIYGDENNLDRMIYVDGVLMNQLLEIYKKHFTYFKEVMDWNKIEVITKEKRADLQHSNKKMIILATSGFLTHGSAPSWLASMIENPRNCILFCGYSGNENSIGYKLKLKEQKTITLNGVVFKNKINVAKLKSFSSHIQHDNLLQLLGDINCEKVVLHHANKSDVLSFKAELEKVYEQKCKTNKVIVPNKSTTIRI